MRALLLGIVCVARVAFTPAAAIKAWEVDTLNAPELAREAQIKLARQRNIRMEEVVADYLQSLRELGLPNPDPAGTRFNSPAWEETYSPLGSDASDRASSTRSDECLTQLYDGYGLSLELHPYSQDHATCPRDARGCASDAAIRKWFELAGILPESSGPRDGDGPVGATRDRNKHDAPRSNKKGDNHPSPNPAAAAAAGAGVAGTNLVAYNRMPRGVALEAIHAYLKAVAMEAPEKLTPDVLKMVVAEIPREALESRRYSVAETLEDLKARIARIGVATVGHQRPGLVAAYEAEVSEGGGGGGTQGGLHHGQTGGGGGGGEDEYEEEDDVYAHRRRRDAADAARASNPQLDPWLTERQHSGGARTKGGGVALSNADANDMVQRVPLQRREWVVGGWKAHDVAVVAAIGLSCALAVGAVLTPIVAPHVFDGTVQGGGGGGGYGKSVAAAARERRERQQRTMAAGLRNSRAGHVVVTGGDGTGGGGGGGGHFQIEMGGDEQDRNWIDVGMDALGRSHQKPVLPIPAVAGYSRESLQQGFNFEFR